MSYPNELLRPLHVSLAELLDNANQMLADGCSDDLVALMLGGRVHVDDEERRVFVNPTEGVDYASLDGCTLQGDFDSLIGVTENLPIELPVAIYPVPQFSRTLTKNVHVTLTHMTGQGLQKTPLHQIANVCFATFGTRAQIRMLFPKLKAQTGSVKVSQEDLADLYNKGILPAVEQVVPGARAHWPPSYRAAMDLYRGPQGIHFGSIDIPERSLPDFADALRENLEPHPRLSGFWFMVEMRGTKGMFTFPIDDQAARQDAFDRLVEHLDLETERACGNMGNWYCDVGVEIICPHHVVQWVSSAHRRLLKHALPSQTDHLVGKVHDGSQFAQDLSGHLTHLAGFRATPGTRGSRDNVHHINVYTTDKAVTYQLHRGAFSAHRTTSLYPRALPKLLDDIKTIARMFAECAGSGGTTQDGTARFEVRVGLERALATLTTFPQELLSLSAVCIPNHLWWDFKYARVVAIHYVLSEFANDPPKARIQLPSLQLGAVLVHILNAVISRPGEWRAEQNLADSSSWHAPEDLDVDMELAMDADFEPEDAVPVRGRQGLYFLCDIIRDSGKRWWRLPARQRMEVPLLLSLYKGATLNEVITNMGGTGLDSGFKKANPTRVQNRRGITPSIEFINPDAIIPLNLPLPPDICFRAKPVLEGRDMDAPIEEMDDEDDVTRDTPVAPVIDRLWAQFFVDVLECSPNGKNKEKPSYITLSMLQRHEVTSDLFKRPALPFVSAWYSTQAHDPRAWRSQFTRYFPPHGGAIARAQNFPSCRYYQLWLRMRSQMSATHFEAIRTQLFLLFRNLLWIPCSESDRMWSTRSPPPQQHWLFLGRDAQPRLGVRILINPRQNRLGDIVLGHAIAEEEEEEADDVEDERRFAPSPRRLRPSLNSPRASLGRDVDSLPAAGGTAHPGARLGSVPPPLAGTGSAVLVRPRSVPRQQQVHPRRPNQSPPRRNATPGPSRLQIPDHRRGGDRVPRQQQVQEGYLQGPDQSSPRRNATPGPSRQAILALRQEEEEEEGEEE